MPDVTPLNPFTCDDATRRFQDAVAALAMINLDPGTEPTCGADTWAGDCVLRHGHKPAVVNEDGHVSRHLAMLCQQNVRGMLDA